MNREFVFVEGETPCFQSRLFNKYGIKHAFFTRLGGVSEGCFSSLNFAEGVGEYKDSTENVLENYNIAASFFGLEKGDVCRTYQEHTALVEYADESKRGVGITKPKFDYGVDGLVTAEKDLLLSVRTADCVPILLCDKENKICAAVHAGWRGTVGGIAKNAVELMVEKGAKRKNILAAIGPCICECCYEVGAEVYREFVETSKEYSRFFKPNGEKYMLDLVAANRFILEKAGLMVENVVSLDMCTKCNEELFFSHRKNGTNRGTLGAFICV